MEYYVTPLEKAGTDRLSAMEESVQASVEQMFWQVAKRDPLSFGVGRSSRDFSDLPDHALRYDSQMRECDGLIAFHAHKALETTLQIIYAKANDKIHRPEKNGGTGHNLKRLYREILQSLKKRRGISTGDPCDLPQQLRDEFESIYQTSLHSGIQDFFLDEKLIYRCFSTPEDMPFQEKRIGGIRDGMEVTMENPSARQLLTWPEDGTYFSKLPCRSFCEFLEKADKAYYKNRNMRWMHYSARDHERGLPYVTVGTRFLARLVQGILEMGEYQWFWDEDFTLRWCEQRLYVTRKRVEQHLKQSSTETFEMPQLITAEDMMKKYSGLRASRTESYDRLHTKICLKRKQK